VDVPDLVLTDGEPDGRVEGLPVLGQADAKNDLLILLRHGGRGEKGGRQEDGE